MTEAYTDVSLMVSKLPEDLVLYNLIFQICELGREASCQQIAGTMTASA